MYVNIIMVAKLEHRSHLAASTTAAALQNAASAPLKCPRCDSANTKFCYYNNYSLAQPRHFCKSCKRYWTRGGTLRNVPVGGGSRKNKRSKKARPTAASPRSPPLPATTNLSPFLYGLPPPKSDLHPLHGYEESFQLSHLQQPTASLLGDYSLLISDHQLPSATYQPLLSYDHGLPLGTENPTHSLDPSYLYWNHGVGSGWPESGPSAAPLH